jgi:hypothetical protein
LMVMLMLGQTPIPAQNVLTVKSMNVIVLVRCIN